MAKTYIVRSGYCAERTTTHQLLCAAIREVQDRRAHEDRCGYYVEPFITTSEADDCSDGLTDDERALIAEELD